MTPAGSAASVSERILVLAPHGRDAIVARDILGEAHLAACVCPDIKSLLEALAGGAGALLIAEEALQSAGYPDLVRWIERQPPWSDLPVVLIAFRGGGIEQNPSARRVAAALGNVSFLERPFHPTTLVSMVEAALRGRRRQYEARERLDAIRAAEAQLERRVAERTSELESANRQLAEQIAERERMEGVLRQAQRLEAVGQLTSGVAHDFNNLLMVVLGNVRQLQHRLDRRDAPRRLRMIAQAAERGAQLTAQMLAFSRRQPLEPQAVDLNETVRGMGELLQSTMGGSIEVRTRLQPDLWTAMIDPTQIELVILNLAINARDAMEVGGALTVETANAILGAPSRAEDPAAGSYVMVAVTDNGSGMTPQTLERAFEPFFTTKDVGRGSGLGLSQVLGLAKQSGGGVRIDSGPGAGTSVKVYLPRTEQAPRPYQTGDVAQDERGSRGANVLLVDDDAAVRDVTARILQDLGYGVLEAGSGGAALDMLDREADIDVLMVDFAMPGMNGAEVAREAQVRRPGLPVLFVTGYADTDALTGAGGAGVLRKPYVQKELAARLRGMLRKQ